MKIKKHSNKHQLLTGRISKVCSVPLFSVIVSESTVAAGESVEAAKRKGKKKGKVCKPECSALQRA